jgi:hypothetical protein
VRESDGGLARVSDGEAARTTRVDAHLARAGQRVRAARVLYGPNGQPPQFTRREGGEDGTFYTSHFLSPETTVIEPHGSQARLVGTHTEKPTPFTHLNVL